MPITTVQAFGAMPADVAFGLALLSDALDGAVPAKQLDRNLIVASWNIRELGRHNGKWTTVQADAPKRNLGDLHYIAEILSRFDVIAVQEVQENLEALRAIMSCLGPDWGFHVTDVSFGDAGDRERLAYLYDLRRVRPSGLAGELVLSPEDLAPVGAGVVADGEDVHVLGLARQLVKTPYMVSFTTASRPFVLTTAHIVWGKDNELAPRAREAEALAKMLGRAVKPPRNSEADPFRASLIALGDFNITAKDDVIFKALVDNGLQPDVGTLDKPRTVNDRPGSKIAYDQFAWFAKGRPGALQFARMSGDTFPWNQHVLVGEPGDTTFRISDHFPLWIEFSVRESGVMELVAIGVVESPLTDRADAPKQGDEGAPAAWLVFSERVAAGLDGVAVGDEVLLFTWLDRAARDVLRVRPRGSATAAEQGVFSTRSPDRPNPIGLHRVTVLEREGARLRVDRLEALHGTPIVDVKPLLRTIDER